jgi:hypothetical protein
MWTVGSVAVASSGSLRAVLRAVGTRLCSVRYRAGQDCPKQPRRMDRQQNLLSTGLVSKHLTIKT